MAWSSPCSDRTYCSFSFLTENTLNIFSGGEYRRILSSYYPRIIWYSGGSGDIETGAAMRQLPMEAASESILLNFMQLL